MSKALFLFQGIVSAAVFASSAMFAGRPVVLLFAASACGAVIVAHCFAIPWLRFRRRPLGPPIAVGILCLSINLSSAIFQWPARLSYAASRPSLEKIATEVRSGRSLSVPRRAGLLVVQRAEIRRGDVVCLWTDFQPGGNSGFVACDAERAEREFNLFDRLSLDDRWQFIIED